MANQPDNFDPLYAAQPQLNSDGLKRISDVMLEKYKNKILELYIGDQSETQNFDDYSTPQNCIIYGKLVDVLDRFIQLECFYVKNNEVHSDHCVFINFFQIRAMTELNGKGALHDIFLSSKSSDKIRKLLLAETSKQTK
jgi:hypothetical protein